ncbi:MAG: hypothetical protein ABIQ90_01995 [Polaromonas sp.]
MVASIYAFGDCTIYQQAMYLARALPLLLKGQSVGRQPDRQPEQGQLFR